MKPIKPKKTIAQLMGRAPALLKGLTRFRSKKIGIVPLHEAATQKVILSGCPDGHMVCPDERCASPFFYFTADTKKNEYLAGCAKCGTEIPLSFPHDVDFKGLPSGDFTCARHPEGQVAIVKCDDTVCIGCRYCNSEIQVDVRERSKGGIFLPS